MLDELFWCSVTFVVWHFMKEIIRDRWFRIVTQKSLIQKLLVFYYYYYYFTNSTFSSASSSSKLLYEIYTVITYPKSWYNFIHNFSKNYKIVIQNDRYFVLVNSWPRMMTGYFSLLYGGTCYKKSLSLTYLVLLKISGI